MTPQFVMKAALNTYIAGKLNSQGQYVKRYPDQNYYHDTLDYHKSSGASEIENLGYSPGYAEPGYSTPEHGILFADWNHFDRRITSILERMGYECEWSDEWSTCESCNKAIRTSPDSYGWQPSYVMGDGWIMCKICFLDDSSAVESYLEERINNPRQALNLEGIDPEKFGFVKVNGDFENGWHPHQNDDPKDILKKFNPDGTREMLFSINSVGQFDMEFSIWERLPATD